MTEPAVFLVPKRRCCAGSGATGPRWCRCFCCRCCSSAAMRCPRCCRGPTPISTLRPAATTEPSHWFGTNALRAGPVRDDAARHAESMLIGLCVALISTVIAATGRIGGRMLRRLARPRADVARRPAAGGAFILIAIMTPRVKQTGSVILLIVLLSLFGWMISSRMIRGMTLVCGIANSSAPHGIWGSQPADHRPAHPAQRRLDPDHRHRAERRAGHSGRNWAQLPGFRRAAARRLAGHPDRRRHQVSHHLPWVFLFPAGVLVTIVLCANLIGDGLRDAVDPGSVTLRRLRGGR